MDLFLQFNRYNKSYFFISYTNTRSRAPECQFFKLLKNKIGKIFLQLFLQILYNFMFSYNYLLVLCCFYRKQMENEKTTAVAV